MHRLFPTHDEKIVITNIITGAARLYHVSTGEILSKGRGRAPVARARMEAIAQVRKRFPHLSTLVIGAMFGRDHSTVLHAIDVMNHADAGAKEPPTRSPVSPVFGDK